MRFVLLCPDAGWGEAIAMNSVLITHFPAEQSMGWEIPGNELLLILVGTLAGIAVKLFEARAILFYILMQVRRLLKLKRDYFCVCEYNKF